MTRAHAPGHAMIVVAGHVCLDIAPHLTHEIDWRPGSLYEVGPATLSVGGVVGNVGSVLTALGAPVRRVGAIGDDAFGVIVRQLVGDARDSGDASGSNHTGANDASGGEGAADGRGGAGDREPPLLAVLTRLPDRATSYTVVVNDPATDRLFLHHPGANEAFGGEELRAGLLALERREPRLLAGAIVHVGYPPVMAGLYTDGGQGFAAALAWARERGARISLDMAMPDPASPAARVDWQAFLARILPLVEVFAPSWSDLTALLGGLPETPCRDDLASTSTAFLELGAKAVLIKLGRRGLYLRTAADHPSTSAWRGRELLSPNFEVEVTATTGAGDATIAGFLATVQRGASPEEALSVASATGACSVAGADAAASVPSLERLEARLTAGWQRTGAAWFGSHGAHESGVLLGPGDRLGARR